MLSVSLHQAGESQEAIWCFARALQVIQQMTLTDYADLHLQLAAHWRHRPVITRRPAPFANK